MLLILFENIYAKYFDITIKFNSIISSICIVVITVNYNLKSLTCCTYKANKQKQCTVATVYVHHPSVHDRAVFTSILLSEQNTTAGLASNTEPYVG